MWPRGYGEGLRPIACWDYGFESRRGHGFLILVECCVSSYLCDGPIPRLDESYHLWFVIVCDLGASRMRRPLPALDCAPQVGEFHHQCRLAIIAHVPVARVTLNTCTP